MGAQTVSPQAPVVVLYGALRSGSTMTRLILDAHPGINCPGERDFMLDFITSEGEGLGLDHQALEMNRIFQGSGLSVPETSDGQAAFFDLLAQEQGGRDEVLIPVMHRKLDMLLQLMPDIRLIHLLRDPRDVARSSCSLGWAGNTWYGIRHWIKTERQWDKVADRLAPEQILEVRYEDLVSDPDTWLPRLCEFVGLPYDAAMLSYPETTSYSKLDPSLCFQWKHKQTPREVALVEHLIGDLLQRRGYEPSGHPTDAPGFVERASLWARNKVSVWRAIFKRYGVIDPILVRIARKLGMPTLARGAQMRVNEKQRKTLK